MGYKIGVDVGGTFTDLAVADEDARLFITKTLTNAGEKATGVLNGLTKVATHYGLGLGELLARTDVIVHGATVATNATPSRRRSGSRLATWWPDPPVALRMTSRRTAGDAPAKLTGASPGP